MLSAPGRQLRALLSPGPASRPGLRPAGMAPSSMATAPRTGKEAIDTRARRRGGAKRDALNLWSLLSRSPETGSHMSVP
jgi:hypothetical protein